MHPTSYSLMIKMKNGTPVIAKLKANIYDYQSNAADPSKLNLKEYRILFDSLGNFETGLYYEGVNIKSTLDINASNTTGRGNSCTITTIRTSTVHCNVDAAYNSTCYLQSNYSVSVSCTPGSTPEEWQDFLDDGGAGTGGGTGGGGQQDTAREIIPDTSITNNPIIKCIVDSIMKGAFADNLLNLLPFGTKIRITSDVLPVDKHGKTDYISATGIFQITINKLDAADPYYNRLLIAKTIYHEIFHAVLTQQVINVTGTNDLNWISTHLHDIKDATTKELLVYYHQEGLSKGYWNPIGHQWLANHFEYMSGLLKHYVQHYYPQVSNNNLHGLKPFYAMMSAGLEEVPCMKYELELRGIITKAEFDTFFSHLNSNACPQ